MEEEEAPAKPLPDLPGSEPEADEETSGSSKASAASVRKETSPRAEAEPKTKRKKRKKPLDKNATKAMKAMKVTSLRTKWDEAMKAAEEKDGPDGQASYPSTPFLRLRLTTRMVKEAQTRKLLLGLASPTALHGLEPVFEEPANPPSAPTPPLKTQEWWLEYQTEKEALAGLAVVLGKQQGSGGLTRRLRKRPGLEAAALPIAGPTGCETLKAKLWDLSAKRELKRQTLETKTVGEAVKTLVERVVEMAEEEASAGPPKTAAEETEDAVLADTKADLVQPSSSTAQ